MSRASQRAPASWNETVRLDAYLKSAFVNRWNLLAVGGATAFGLLSGRADIALPIILAIETVYVALLASHPKFQKYVDAQNAQHARSSTEVDNSQALQQILSALPARMLERYERLRSRCLSLRRIATDLKRSRGQAVGSSSDEFQVEGLDKLLWIYIRLLFTQFSLQRFLEHTSEVTIEREIQTLEKRLKALPSDDSSPINVKMRRTLEDNLQTCRDRLANYRKAQSNHELVGLELDRLENKINSLAEIAINRQEPDYIAHQVDAVAGSMLEMEKTMSELQFATGLAPLRETTPDLLLTEPSSPKVRTR
jgi:chemotaxis protein histidine kinase CheA